MIRRVFRVIEALAVLLDLADMLSYLASLPPVSVTWWLLLLFLGACLVAWQHVKDRGR